MSRMSVAAFLSKAKQSLSKTLKSNGEHPAYFVIGNESADLDSITCAIVYGYIQSSTLTARKADRFTIPITNIRANEVRLRPELAALLQHANLKPSDLVTLDDLGEIWQRVSPSSTHWTLVDHNVLQGALGEHFSNQVQAVIDHHEDEGKAPEDANPRIITTSGSCNSLVVNHLREEWEALSASTSTSGAAHGQGDGALDDAAYTSSWDAQVAKLALGSILIDTVNLTDKNKTTEHDRKAVRYVEAKINVSRLGKTYDRDAFFKEINDAKANLDDLTVEEIMGKDYKEWEEGGMTLGVSSCVRSVEYLLKKERNLMPVLLKFAKEEGVDLFALMTAHQDSGEFRRQLLLVAVDGGPAEEVARKFAEVQGQQLQLKQSEVQVGDSSEAGWIQLWEQKELAASRKQVAPALRQAMR